MTAAPYPVGAVVCVHAKGMKDPWCLATSEADATPRAITNYYAKRWTIEPSFRDTKDLRFDRGLGKVRISDPQRRDRLLRLNAFAIALLTLLTLLGTAGESLGMDRHLKVNTVKHRTHSLFRQGCMLYDLIPNMPAIRLRPFIQRFYELLQQNGVRSMVFAAAYKYLLPHMSGWLRAPVSRGDLVPKQPLEVWAYCRLRCKPLI